MKLSVRRQSVAVVYTSIQGMASHNNNAMAKAKKGLFTWDALVSFFFPSRTCAHRSRFETKLTKSDDAAMGLREFSRWVGRQGRGVGRVGAVCAGGHGVGHVRGVRRRDDVYARAGEVRPVVGLRPLVIRVMARGGGGGGALGCDGA